MADEISSLPTPPAPENPPEPEQKLSTVRTFKQDVSTTVAEKGVSLADVALSAGKKRPRDATIPVPPSRRYASAALAIFLILAGGYAAWLGVKYVSGPGLVSPEGDDTSLIFAETKETVEITERLPIDIRSIIAEKIRTADIRIGSVRAIEFMARTPLRQGSGDPGPVGENQPLLRAAAPLFISAVESTMPDGLRRNLSSPFMFGIFSLSRNNGFLILKPASFEIAFAEMLEWESDVVRDLYPILTGDPAPTSLGAALFEDRVIRNRDTRVVLDESGAIKFVYSFVSRDTLVIAPDTETFIEVLTRLNTPRPVSR